MNPLRSALLWASESPTLKERVPTWRFVRRALRQFMPGEKLEDALGAARGLAQRGIVTTFTALGEHLNDIAEADGVTDHYLGVLDEVHRRGLDTEISVKLSHLGLDLDQARTSRHLRSLAERARELDNWVWIDMESSTYIDATLEVFRQVRPDFPNVGICLQSYLRRTGADLDDLLPLHPGIRLVKGAYREPNEIAFQSKRDVDAEFLRLSVTLLDRAADGDLRIAMATHDVPLLDRVAALASERGLGRDAYEVQMLYGIRMADQYRIAAEGYPMRDLVAYGSAWYPWYVRRLAERPANLLFVMRNMFGAPPPQLD